jgi:hypothetical protein
MHTELDLACIVADTSIGMHGLVGVRRQRWCGVSAVRRRVDPPDNPTVCRVGMCLAS